MDRDNLTILFGGDTMLGRGVNDVINKAGPLYPVAPLVPITREADLFLINLECAITDSKQVYSGPEKAFYFRADPVASETLTHAGVDVVSLANNHALDANEVGLRDTLKILNQNNIIYAGAGENAEQAARPAVMHTGGYTIGLLAYCDHQQDFAANSGRPGIRYVDVAQPGSRSSVIEDTKALAAVVDHVVVAAHWQSNWVRRIPRLYRNFARSLVDAGARIVWGHSPHHFLGVEWMERNVVLYSTGDLIDDYAVEPTFRNDRQLLFRVRLSQQGVDSIEALPIELEFARTRPAGAEASNWIVERFVKMCASLGSHVAKDDGWLNVRPDSNYYAQYP